MCIQIHMFLALVAYIGFGLSKESHTQSRYETRGTDLSECAPTEHALLGCRRWCWEQRALMGEQWKRFSDGFRLDAPGDKPCILPKDQKSVTGTPPEKLCVAVVSWASRDRDDGSNPWRRRRWTARVPILIWCHRLDTGTGVCIRGCVSRVCVEGVSRVCVDGVLGFIV